MNIAINGTGTVGASVARILSKTRHGFVFGPRSTKNGHAAAEAFIQAHGRSVQAGDTAPAR